MKKLNEEFTIEQAKSIVNYLKTNLSFLTKDHYLDIYAQKMIGDMTVTIDYANGKDENKWANGYIRNDKGHYRLLIQESDKSPNVLILNAVLQPRTLKFRSKQGTPEQIQKYIVDWFKKNISNIESLSPELKESKLHNLLKRIIKEELNKKNKSI